MEIITYLVALNRFLLPSSLQIFINLYVIWCCFSWLFHIDFKEWIGNFCYNLFQHNQQVQLEFKKVEDKLRHTFQRPYLNNAKHSIMPQLGVEKSKILKTLKEWVTIEDPKWRNGQVSGGVYHGDQDHLDFMNQVYDLYSVSNPLHPDIWPSLRQMEAEIVSMTANLMNPTLEPDIWGTVTSGGTESIILSCKAHREYYNYREPEMIIPSTAHAAFEKAAHLLKIKLIKVPVNQVTFKVNPAEMEARITGNTIMLVGSAPQFPHGIVDPLAELSEIALRRKIGFHVDACLGSFLLPFVKLNDPDFPIINFSHKGITAMSLDTHKFGFAPKGSSVILYRGAKLRRCQYFTFTDWPGGLYTTSNLSGSRVGGLSAACWAAMVNIGKDGYQNFTDQILTTAQEIKNYITNHSELMVLGDPKLMVISFTVVNTSKLNIFQIGDRLSQLGWSLNTLQHPPALHICVTLRQVNKSQKFIEDLDQTIIKLLAEYNLNGQINKNSSDLAPIYGQVGMLPSGPIDQILRVYQDIIWEINDDNDDLNSEYNDDLNSELDSLLLETVEKMDEDQVYQNGSNEPNESNEPNKPNDSNNSSDSSNESNDSFDESFDCLHF